MQIDLNALTLTISLWQAVLFVFLIEPWLIGFIVAALGYFINEKERSHSDRVFAIIACAIWPIVFAASYRDEKKKRNTSRS